MHFLSIEHLLVEVLGRFSEAAHVTAIKTRKKIKLLKLCFRVLFLLTEIWMQILNEDACLCPERVKLTPWAKAHFIFLMAPVDQTIYFSVFREVTKWHTCVCIHICTYFFAILILFFETTSGIKSLLLKTSIVVAWQTSSRFIWTKIVFSTRKWAGLKWI